MKYTYTSYLTLLRDMTQNDDVDATVLQRYLNAGAGMLFGRVKNDKNRASKTFVTVASTDEYSMPISIQHIVSMKVTIGTEKYPIYPVENQRKWDLMKSNSFTSDQPTHFFVRGRTIILYPTPSAVKTITIIGQAVPNVLNTADYTTGTVTLTNGSTTVTGSGTTFTALMAGRYIQATPPSGDGFWYKIASFSTTTSMALEQIYEGTTTAGLTYTVGQMFDLPEDLQEGPAHYAAMRYFQYNRRNPKKYREHQGEFNSLLELADNKYGFKTVYPVQGTSTLRMSAINPNNYPHDIG